MSDFNSVTQKAAEEMTHPNNVEEFKKEIATEGIYNTVVEGRYHRQILSDENAYFLSEILVNQGVNGLVAHANQNEREEGQRNVAQITPLVSTTGPSFEEIISRLDDGNEYPGFYLDYDQEQKFFMLYEDI